MEKDESYYESLDKRTKEYKEWVARKEQSEAESPQGLGDKVEKVLEATGIAKAVKFIAGEDCGCNERKAKLNQMFPTLKPECFTEEEYSLLKGYVDSNKKSFSPNDQKDLLDVYNRVFHQNENMTNCGPCLSQKYNKLIKLLNEYDN